MCSLSIFFLLFALIVQLNSSVQGSERPNVLFIIADDLNDMPLHPDGKPYVPTPNFDRLAARGVSFTNAHCNDPICAPSRSSMMTGIYPQTSGLYWFEDYRQNAILKDCVTLTEHLATNGYGVYSTGKIYHGNQDPKGFFAGYGSGGNIGPWPWDGRRKTKRGFIPHPAQLYFYADDADPDMGYQWEHTFGPLSRIPEYQADPANGIPGYKGWTLSGEPWRYISDEDRDPMPDETHAEWTAEILRRDHEKPFALFTGFSRTHTPLYAPQHYFDLFPLEEIEIPGAFQEGDLEDCAPTLANTSLYAFRRYQMLFKHQEHPHLFKEYLQAYMACVAFVDDQVGTVLDALEASPHADNTIVILTSDHGFHVGGKESIYKQTLWDSGTRIPFIVAGLAGMAEGVTCHQPISLIDVYPSFVDICKLPKDPNAAEGRSGYRLEGHSIKPLLLDPSGDWSGPEVAIMALPGKDHSQHREHIGTLFPHFSVRSEDYRYSLTSDGQEELYHYPSDPNEFTNLASNDDYAAIKAELRAQLISLRDGDRWRSLETLPQGELKSFELLTEVTGDTRILFGESILAEVTFDQAAQLRIRVAGNRCQVWANNRVYSDVIEETDFASGRLSSAGAELTKIRIREL
ncbi:MAG: sulfatase [Verrucomicrobiota bacterium]